MLRTYSVIHLLRSNDLASSGLLQRKAPPSIYFLLAFNTDSTIIMPATATPIPRFLVPGEFPYIDIIVDCTAARRSMVAYAHLTLTIVFRDTEDRKEEKYDKEKSNFERIVFCEPLPLSVQGNYAVKKRLNGPFEVNFVSRLSCYYTWHSYAPATEPIQTGTDEKGCPIYEEVPILYEEYVKITLIAPPTKGILYDK